MLAYHTYSIKRTNTYGNRSPVWTGRHKDLLCSDFKRDLLKFCQVHTTYVVFHWRIPASLCSLVFSIYVGAKQYRWRCVLASIVHCCFEHCICSGQTGSGKTFTMLGASEDSNSFHSETRGVIPRGFDYMFKLLQKEQEVVSWKIICIRVYRSYYISLGSTVLYCLFADRPCGGIAPIIMGKTWKFYIQIKPGPDIFYIMNTIE